MIMTKKRKTLKIVICALLALAMIGFISIGVIAERYGIYVADEAVTRGNKGDILGDGTVVNCGATIDGEIDAIGGIHNRDEN